MIVVDKPDLNEDLLVHFGIRGMHWGQRKSGSSSGSSDKSKMSTKKKVAIGAGVAVAAGSIATAIILSRRGKIPVRQTLGHRPGFSSPDAARRVQNDISQSVWKKRVADLRKDMASAHADQDRWMRSQGLGSAVNRKASKVDLSDIADVRRAMNDPNHIWDI